MTNKTLDQLSSLTPPVAATDIFPVLRSAAGTLTSVAWSVIVSTMQTALSSVFLQINNNLSDLASAATARANLGLGLAAVANYQPVKTVSGKVVDANNDVDVPFFRNRLINGDMRIDQRLAGANVTPTAGRYTVDRWNLLLAAASKFQIGQNLGAVTPPNGFANYLGVKTVSATVPGASDVYNIQQSVEGYNIADFLWGTASAKAATLSGLVYSSLTGTFAGAITGVGGRSYVFTFNIPVANTWTPITVTIPGDTGGAWAVGNAATLITSFCLGAGATPTGAPGAWGSGALWNATGAVSVIGTLNATFYVTGVQLEAGASASTFERRPLATEMRFCQRYYENNMPTGTAPADGAASEAVAASAFGTNGVLLGVNFKVEKRAAPTIAFFRNVSNASAGQWGVLTNGAWGDMTGTAASRQTTKGFSIAGTFTIANGTAVVGGGGWTADAEL